MKRRHTVARLCSCIIALLLAAGRVTAAQPLPLDKIKLPPGFAISIFADNVPNARAMTLGDKGTLFVGSMRAGKVYTVRLRDNRAIETRVIHMGGPVRNWWARQRPGAPV